MGLFSCIRQKNHTMYKIMFLILYPILYLSDDSLSNASCSPWYRLGIYWYDLADSTDGVRGISFFADRAPDARLRCTPRPRWTLYMSDLSSMEPRPSRELDTPHPHGSPLYQCMARWRPYEYWYTDDRTFLGLGVLCGRTHLYPLE
jgi:hypothetical protein